MVLPMRVTHVDTHCLAVKAKLAPVCLIPRRRIAFLRHKYCAFFSETVAYSVKQALTPDRIRARQPVVKARLAIQRSVG
jgi:hypothetical protein